jgi:hypothetical protein
MKLRFNPFAKVDCRYGAPHGRHGHAIEDAPRPIDKLLVTHCGGDGFYDRGGAYWGHSRVYAVHTADGSYCTYVGAISPKQALKFVEEASHAPVR